MTNYPDIDQYIATFPVYIATKLNKIRATIRNVAPLATEKISYGMPTFVFNGLLVHFEAQKNHIGFYPAPSGIEAFSEKLSEWKHSKGAVQFPNDEEIPYALIEEITKYRYHENLKK
ncbi:MAG: DUF1801 domain-containing protein [Paludibacteraceae bacterium]|nr:DUF1801 domain-containing protein [Paludibacteraceae bacterium]